MACSVWLSFALTLVVVVVVVVVQLTTAMPSGGHKKSSRLRGGSGYKDLLTHRLHHGRPYSSTYDPEYYKDECMSQGLTCVPEEECVTKTQRGYTEGRVCPINFVPHDSLCVFLGVKKAEPRTQAQVVEYCRTQRTRPYYFQNAQEWRDFYEFVIQYVDGYYDMFMLDARWEKDYDRWEWLSTGEEIEWEKLLHQGKCSKENKEVVRREDGCLGFYIDWKSRCLRLKQVDCTDEALPFICKDGSYDSRCGQNENSLCCSSPTYSYYSKNKYGGTGSHGIHGQSKRQCWVKVDYPITKSITCHNALDLLGNLHPYPQPVRVGRSYYYFSRNPCRISRQAVVAGMEVHDFIVSYLLTEELVVEDQTFIVGLRYEPEDDEFFWVNGKVIHYYNNETYWANGQPDKQSGTSKVSCVAYKKNGKNSYAWHLLPSVACSGPSTVNVCEMPIRSTKLVPSAKKVECGQRLGRGVLARAAYGTAGYDDDEEAHYGEFPWHVAVLQPRNYDGVVMEFACSGVLIHPEYVLTSAHCIIYSGNGDFSVSFGEWDLNDDRGQILDTKLVAVNEVIIHPNHKSKSVMDDVALLQLEDKVDVDSYPHIGLGCLPNTRLFYEASGEWDCFTVGWPSTKHKNNDERILRRIESDFLSSRRCRHYTKTYYDHAREHYKEDTGYDKEYGAHGIGYQEHDYFENDLVSLICTEPYESHSCLDDNTPILVCKKASIFIDSPLSGNYYNGREEYYDDHHGSGNKHHGPREHYDDYSGHGNKPHRPRKQYNDHSGPREHYDHGSKHHNKGDSDHRGGSYASPYSNRLHLWNTRIINSFGEDRFDSDKWYVMGIGHDLNSCDDHDDPPKKGDRRHHRRPHQVFTPVQSYLSFIHQHLEPYPSTLDGPEPLALHPYSY